MTLTLTSFAALRAKFDLDNPRRAFCFVCSRVVSETHAAGVAFKMANGGIGQITANVCLPCTMPPKGQPEVTPKVPNIVDNRKAIYLTGPQSSVLMELRNNHVNSDLHNAFNSSPMISLVTAKTGQEVALAIVTMRSDFPEDSNEDNWPVYSLPCKADGSAHQGKLKTLSRALLKFSV